MPHSQSHPSPPIRIAIIGAGGLAVGAAWALINGWDPSERLELLILDPDVVEISNLNRQLFFQLEDVGKPKADALARRLNSWPTFAQEKGVTIIARQAKLDLDSIEAVAKSASLVLDACDSTEAKFLINDYCVAHSLPFCYGGAVGYGGQCFLYNPTARNGCLRCLFGDFSEADYIRQTTTCQAAGIIGGVAGFTGMLQGEECLQFIRAAEPERTTAGGVLKRFTYPQIELKTTSVQPDAVCPLGCGLEQKSFLDLKAQRCPATFLYTKLALERLADSTVLDVRFSSSESTENVSRSVLDEGHLLIGEPRRLASSEWQVMIEKRARA